MANAQENPNTAVELETSTVPVENIVDAVDAEVVKKTPEQLIEVHKAEIEKLNTEFNKLSNQGKKLQQDLEKIQQTMINLRTMHTQRVGAVTALTELING